jgi:hypothetical protein
MGSDLTYIHGVFPSGTQVVLHVKEVPGISIPFLPILIVSKKVMEGVPDMDLVGKRFIAMHELAKTRFNNKEIPSFDLRIVQNG